MPFCENDGVKIYYEVEGSGPEVIMIHGFAANLEINWRTSGITDALKAENRCIMMDCRGHGKSDKPTDPAMYGEKMVDDIICLTKHLGIEKANFVGYSMGSRLSLQLLLSHPELFKSAILGGFVLPDAASQHSRADFGPERRNIVVKALLADSIDQVDAAVGKEFRRFAESTGGDLKALAAVMTATAESEAADRLDPEATLQRLRSIPVPLMTIVGNDDFLPGDKSRMAMLVPGGIHVQIEGKDHLTVVPDPKFRMAVRAFLNHVNGR